MTRTQGNLSGPGATDAAAAPAPDGGRSRSTLLIVASLVFLAGVFAWLAVPRWRESERRMRVQRTAEQIRSFARALQVAAKQRGDWPPATTAAGEFPPGMKEVLGEAWARRTPVGGRYMWEPHSLHRGQRHRAAILIRPVAGNPLTDDRALLVAIDRTLDDGNLRTGSFQLGYRNQPVFSLEQ